MLIIRLPHGFDISQVNINHGILFIPSEKELNMTRDVNLFIKEQQEVLGRDDNYEIWADSTRPEHVITLGDLKQLVESDRQLSLLDDAGVDNWEGNYVRYKSDEEYEEEFL